MSRYLLKVRRNGGGESVLGSFPEKSLAQAAADELNTDYQSDNYYVEEYDPVKAAGFNVDKIVNDANRWLLGGE